MCRAFVLRMHAPVVHRYGLFATDAFQLRSSLNKPGLSGGARLKRLWYCLAWVAPLSVELLNPGRPWPLVALLLLAMQCVVTSTHCHSFLTCSTRSIITSPSL